jgi:RNA polymerase sigma-70 factor (ECF subfamily)
MSDPGAPPPFDQALADHGAMIRRIAAAHEADAAALQDLIQDIHYALWRALPGWRGEGPLRSFVAKVAANRAISHVQRALKRPPAEELPETLIAPEASPESRAIARDQAKRLAAAVRALPLGLRETALMALEGLGHAEIAAVLGVTTNAVAVRMTRAKAELQKRMEDDRAE